MQEIKKKNKEKGERKGKEKQSPFLTNLPVLFPKKLSSPSMAINKNRFDLS